MIIDQSITTAPLSICKPRRIDSRVICNAVSEDKLGAYSLFEVTVSPQAGPSRQAHHWEKEVYYILEGEFLIQKGDRTFTLAAGSFVDFPQAIPHTFKNVGTASARLLAIITPAWYGKFFEEWVSQQQNSSLRHLRLLHQP